MRALHHGHCYLSTSRNGITMTTPQPIDVILGRGKRYGKHPGNVIFQDLVQSKRLRYFESSFPVKRAIIAEVMDTIQSRGGRFLRLKDNVWSVTPDETVRLKIAHAIQYHIRTEFSHTKGLSLDVESALEQGLSDHDRIVKKIQENICKQRNKNLPNASPMSNHNIVSDTSTETPTGNEHERQVSSHIGAIDIQPARARPYISDFARIKNKIQFNILSKANHRSSIAVPSTTGMDYSIRNCSCKHSTRMPYIKPVVEEDATSNQLRQFNPAMFDHSQLQHNIAPHYLHSSDCVKSIDDQTYGTVIYDNSADIYQPIPYLHDVSTHPQQSHHRGDDPRHTVPSTVRDELDLSGVWD